RCPPHARSGKERQGMQKLALSMLALAGMATSLKAQAWPFNLEPQTPFVDVQVDAFGAPLMLLGAVTDGCGGGIPIVHGVTDTLFASGFRVRLHARVLWWYDSRPCADGEQIAITWEGNMGGGAIGYLNHTAPSTMATWSRGEQPIDVTDPHCLGDMRSEERRVGKEWR